MQKRAWIGALAALRIWRCFQSACKSPRAPFLHFLNVVIYGSAVLAAFAKGSYAIVWMRPSIGGHPMTSAWVRPRLGVARIR